MKNIYLLSSFMKSFRVLSIYVLTAAVLLPHNAFSDDKPVDIMPVVTTADGAHSLAPENTTHPIVRLTPDKSELIHLDGEAGSIIIGNPLHINVIADSSTTLVIVPRSPGATHFTVLSKQGEVLMQRHVIVASPKENYIRVKKTCREDSGDDCQKTNVFYCPDMCHEIGLAQDDEKSSDDSDSKDDAGGNDKSGGNSNDPPPEE